MLVDFDTLNNQSRVWIYQSNREFNDAELVIVKNEIEQFLAGWKRHGEDLKAAYKIVYNQFIVIAVDESFNNVSGCSIDASVNKIKNLEKALGVDLTNRMNVSFKINDSVNVVSLSDFQQFAKEQKIKPNTVVFNNLVGTKQEFITHWEIPAEKSWHSRYLAH